MCLLYIVGLLGVDWVSMLELLLFGNSALMFNNCFSLVLCVLTGEAGLKIGSGDLTTVLFTRDILLRKSLNRFCELG